LISAGTLSQTPDGEAHSAPPDPVTRFERVLHLRQEKEWEGKRGKGKMKRGKKGEGKEGDGRPCKSMTSIASITSSYESIMVDLM